MSAPRDNEGAFLLATFFRSTGGTFAIDSLGNRHIVVDLEATGDRCRLQTMFEAMLKRLHPDDKALIFDAFAEVAVDPDTITATFSEPVRRAA